jgi:hypothetical protein
MESEVVQEQIRFISDSHAAFAKELVYPNIRLSIIQKKQEKSSKEYKRK